MLEGSNPGNQPIGPVIGPDGQAIDPREAAKIASIASYFLTKNADEVAGRKPVQIIFDADGNQTEIKIL